MSRKAASPTQAERAMHFWSLPSDDALVDRATAAAAAGLGKKSMDLLAMNGRGPVYMIVGKSSMYRVGDVKAWLGKRKTVRSTAERALPPRKAREGSRGGDAGAA